MAALRVGFAPRSAVRRTYSSKSSCRLTQGPSEWADIAAEEQKSGHYNLQGAARDLQMVEKLAMARSENPRQATKLVHKMLDKAQHLLTNRATWAAVKMIADELIENESISGRSAKHYLAIAQNQSD